MATFSLNGGVNEREPTAISDSQPQDCDGAEYRVGQPGIYVARGRDQIGDVGGVTNKSLYEAGFAGANARLIVHEGNSLHSAEITSSTLSFDLIHNLPSGSSAAVGCHYANRHYLATNVENRKLELIGAGVTASLIGMSASTFTVGVSATQGSGSLSSAAGLEYWATEYDSTRGIESIYGSTANTGAISSVDSVVVSVTGDPINPNANQIRWYRSTDGGAYPDGGLIQTTSIATKRSTNR